MHRCPSHVLLWRGYMYVRMYTCIVQYIHAHLVHHFYLCHVVRTSLTLSTHLPMVPIFFHLPFSLCLLPFLFPCTHLPPSSTNPCAQSEVEPTQTFTVSIADCPVGNVLMRVESGSVYQTCQCVAGGDSPILQCDLDRDILILKVGIVCAGQGGLVGVEPRCILPW